jgi:copper chaperone CopZ
VYNVSGMTCTGCANKVRNLLGEMSGIDQVDVDLSAGRVTLQADQHVADAHIIDALEEAGYEAVRA